MITKNLRLSALLVLGIISIFYFAFGATTHAATPGYYITVNKTYIESGMEVTVNFSAPVSDFSTRDKIVVWNNEEHEAVASLSVGKERQGSLIYQLWSPSTYNFRYERYGQKGVTEAESNLVEVVLPTKSRYTVDIDNDFYYTGETVNVDYVVPSFAHDRGDQIALYDINDQKIVSKQTVGDNIDGTKAFTIPGSGVYEFRYLMKKVSNTPVKSSIVFTAALPPKSEYTMDVTPLNPSIREEITVAFTVPSHVHNQRDKINMINVETGKSVEKIGVGEEYSGEVKFIASEPGRYIFVYELGTLDKVQVAKSSEFGVSLPNPDEFDIQVTPDFVFKGDLLTVDFNVPRIYFNSEDTISLVDSSKNKAVEVQQVGVNSTGSLEFLVPYDGNFEVQYNLDIAKNSTLKIVPLNGNKTSREVAVDNKKEEIESSAGIKKEESGFRKIMLYVTGGLFVFGLGFIIVLKVVVPMIQNKQINAKKEDTLVGETRTPTKFTSPNVAPKAQEPPQESVPPQTPPPPSSPPSSGVTNDGGGDFPPTPPAPDSEADKNL